MKGLLLKDFYNLKVVIIFFLIISLFMDLICISILFGGIEEGESLSLYKVSFESYTSSITLIYIMVYISCSVLVSSFSFDEKSRRTPFIVSVGVRKNKIIQSKIVLGLISMAFLIIPFSIVCAIYGIYIDYRLVLIALSAFISSFLFTCLVIILSCIAIGSSKMIIFANIISILTSLIPILFNLLCFLNEFMYYNYFYIVIANIFIFSIGIPILLYKITLKVFNKRDF